VSRGIDERLPITRLPIADYPITDYRLPITSPLPLSRPAPRGAALVSIASVVVLFAAFRLIEQFGSPDWSSPLGEATVKCVVWGVASVLVVAAAYRASPRAALEELGLWSNPLPGLALGVAATLPLIGWTTHGVHRLSEGRVVAEVLLGPFAEEVLFRGVLFRQLYRRAGRRVVRAMIVSALVFGFAHLASIDLSLLHWNLQQVWVLVGEATLGGLLFAWLTYRWNSLWPAIAVHAALNLSWDLTVSNLQDLVTITRVGGVVIVIGATLVWTRTGTRGRY
jgi:membrane protease YdiL (CAAX protease family)